MLHVSMKRERIASAIAHCTLVVAFTLQLGACGGGSIPRANSNPIDENSSGVGMWVELRTPLRIVKRRPDIVVFARLEEGMKLEQSTELYGSTFSDDGCVYFMNVEPGDYVAVAAIIEDETSASREASDGSSSSTVEKSVKRAYFSRDLIERTRVRLGPGEFIYVGKLSADLSASFGEGDACQRHFRELMDDPSNRSWSAKLGDAVAGEQTSTASLHEFDTSPAAKQEFLARAKAHFADTGWLDLITAQASERANPD